MAKYTTKYIGTDDLVGAVVTGIDSSEMYLEKDGRTLGIELEMDSDYHSMCGCECGGCCGPGYSYAYFRAIEVVEVQKRKK